MSPTLTWVPGTYSAARRDDVLDPITADILHVDGEPTRWAVQIEHDPKGVTDIGDVFFGGMRLPFVSPRGRAPGLDCAADLIAKHAAAARAIAEAIIAKAGLLGTDDAVVIVTRMDAVWPGVDVDRAAYLDFVRAADPSPPDGYIPAPVGCDDDEDDDWSVYGEDHWGDDGGPELVAALNLCATLRAERDAALADVTAWRAFAVEAARLLASPGAEDYADFTTRDDLPVLLDVLRGALTERDAAVARALAAEAGAVLLRHDALVLVGLANTCATDALSDHESDLLSDAVLRADLMTDDQIVAVIQRALDGTVEKHAALAVAARPLAAAEAAVRLTEGLLSEGLEIVEGLSAGHDVWAQRVRAALGGGE